MIYNLFGMLTKNLGKIITVLKRKTHFIFIFFLWFLTAISQLIFLRLDRLPPLGDGIRFILRGMELFMINSQIGLWEFIKEVFKVVDSGPPFVDITYFLYYKLFGFSTEMELIVNSLYLGAGIIGVYGIGKYFFNRNTGVLAVLIFTTLPGVLIFNNLGYREFHIMCIVALTLYFLFYSDNFANGKFSILFGASLGLLFMIKYQGLIFVAVPIFKTLADVIYKRFFLKKESKGLFFNITISLTLFFIIGLFWYVVNWRSFFNIMKNRINNLPSGDFIFTIKNLFFYSKGLFDGMLYRVYSFLFIGIGLCNMFICIRKKNIINHSKNILIIYFYFMIPFLFFTFLGLKEFSHMLPLLPFISVVIAGGYNLIINKYFKKGFFIIIIFMHIIPIYISPILKIFCRTNGCFAADTMSPIDKFIYRFTYEDPIKRPYSINIEEWDSKIKGILQFIKNDYLIGSTSSNDSNNKPRVLLLANSLVFRFFQLEYYNNLEGKPVNLISIIFPIGPEPKDPEKHIFGNNYDYLLMETAEDFIHGQEDKILKDTLAFIRDNIDRVNKKYILIGEFVLPGESTKALVYKRIN